MIDLDTLANLAQVLGAVAVIAGIGFGLLQLHQFRQQRRDAAALELAHVLQSPAFIKAFRLLHTLPDDISAEELRARGHEYEEAAVAIAAMFETIGLLVFREVASFDSVRELMGGVTQMLWKKIRTWARDVRAESSEETLVEWLQWLAERLAEYDRLAQDEPAYRQFAAWRPE